MMEHNIYKRTTKKMPQQQKEKIRQSLKRFNETHPRSDAYRKKISDGCKKYWSQFKTDDTKIEDLI